MSCSGWGKHPVEDWLSFCQQSQNRALKDFDVKGGGEDLLQPDWQS